jgi:hypothetical protein
MGQNISHKYYDTYAYNIKAYESTDDFIDNNSVICCRFYIPSENIEFNIFKNKLNVINVNVKHLEELVKNIDVSNLTKIKLKKDFVISIKKYYNLKKQQDNIFNNIEYIIKSIELYYNPDDQNRPDKPDNKFEYEEVSLL